MPSIHLGQIIWKICVCHIIILDFAMVAGFVVVKWLPLCVSNLPHLEEDCVVCVTSAVPCRLFPPDSDCVNQSLSFKNRSRIK